jgi:hypothetical protein
MHQELNEVGFPELMTEMELMCFLRIPDVGRGETCEGAGRMIQDSHSQPQVLSSFPDRSYQLRPMRKEVTL